MGTVTACRDAYELVKIMWTPIHNSLATWHSTLDYFESVNAVDRVALGVVITRFNPCLECAQIYILRKVALS